MIDLPTFLLSKNKEKIRKMFRNAFLKFSLKKIVPIINFYFSYARKQNSGTVYIDVNVLSYIAVLLRVANAENCAKSHALWSAKVLFFLKNAELEREQHRTSLVWQQICVANFNSTDLKAGPIHTADADATKLSSCVASASAVCTTWIRN